MPAFGSTPRRAASCATPGSTRPTSRPGSVFPDNSGLDWDSLGDCDYLYVSHLHKDHFDAKLLAEHVNKDAVVLLPDFPVPDLKRELCRCWGFTGSSRPTIRSNTASAGPRATSTSWSSRCGRPADGPIGDSGAGGLRRRDDGLQHERLPARSTWTCWREFGHVDVHMLQYSGAIWYPMVYDMPARAKEAFGTQKRQRGMDRCPPVHRRRSAPPG